MSRTMIMLSCSSLKTPFPTTSSALELYPSVRNVMELATRCGVLSRPSRSGSSPSNSSSRRISFSNSLFTCVFDIVVFSLPQDQPGELAGPDLGIEYAPEREDDVLGCWNNALHEGHVEIEVLVVHDIDDLAFDDFLELGKVANIPRFGVY